MMRRRPRIPLARLWLALGIVALGPSRLDAAQREPFQSTAMPSGVRVVNSELDGAVFADARGKTLYQWPLRQMRSGVTGDHLGTSECNRAKTEVSAGFMSPYPGGLRLPDLEQHLSCAQVWPPFVAPAGAKPVGSWTLIERKDGRRQWAYEDLPVYTFYLDRRPGDVLGGRADKRGGDAPAGRRPIGPPPDVPAGFAVKTMSTGRLLVTTQGFTVYASDQDTATRSNCDAACAQTWVPLIAPSLARPHGEWASIERTLGVKQWTFRGRPLYRYSADPGAHRFTGEDVPGWHSVYTQRAPDPPAGFTVQDTTAGQVLADQEGRTLYTYFCGDDGADQLGCDLPEETQVYRLAVCGGGDVQRCLRSFPYVIAAPDARATSRTWSILSIDPQSGRRVPAGDPRALRVWAFRDRPVYTYAGDEHPGDVHADSHGEFRGERNGYRAIWLRDDFFQRNQPGPG